MDMIIAVTFHANVAKTMMVMAPITFLSLQFVSAPYGKHDADNKIASAKAKKAGGGVKLPAKLCWVVMESPNVWWSLYFWYVATDGRSFLPARNLILLTLFTQHYVNRSFIYPLRQRSPAPMPLHVMLSALTFCLVNGYLQAFDLVVQNPNNNTPELIFWIGVAIWWVGFYLNVQADDILRSLRSPTDKPGTYKIPHGGLFDYVSGANFAGECIEWFGFALASNSTASWAFFCFTFANVAPRAKDTHDWYLRKFGKQYEELGRSAILPGIY